MIPSVMIIGLLTGLLAVDGRGRTAWRRIALGAVIIPAVFGVVVFASDSTAGTLVGGGLIALANFAVGAAVGVGVRVSGTALLVGAGRRWQRAQHRV